MPDSKQIASQVRRDILRMVHGAARGHPGGSPGWADFVTALYFDVMNHKAAFERDGKDDDVSDGATSEVGCPGDFRVKFEAFRWTTLSMNGNDIDEVIVTLKQAKAKTRNGRPAAIMMHTVMGKGVDFMENDHNWDGTGLMTNN